MLPTTSRRIIGNPATQSPILPQTTPSVMTTSLPQSSILISSTSTHGFQTSISPTPTPTPSLIPTPLPMDRITVVGIVCSLTLLILITTVLFCIVYCIAYTLRRRQRKRYSQFVKEGHTTPTDKYTEQDSENTPSFNPVYLTESFLENEGQQSLLQDTLVCLKAGIEVEATQDYFEPGIQKETPLFLKGDRITIRRVEGDPRGAVMAWVRGDLDGREVCFPSYVVHLVDKLEDTFDTLSNPTRRESQLAQEFSLTVDSAPAELESIFHEVESNLDAYDLNALPFNTKKYPRRYSSMDAVSCERKVKRPTRIPPRPPSSIEAPSGHSKRVPKLPPKSNRPKLSSHEKGSKETNELLFVPPPLSSSTPVRKVAPKTRPKPTKGIRGLMRTKGARPDTPDAKSRKPKVAPRGYSWSPDSPGQILPVASEPIPSRPDPPFTPSTLSLILNAVPGQGVPEKPPPPKIYETVEQLKSVIASRSDPETT